MDIEQPEIQQQLLARAMKDEVFHQELKNPKAAVEREFGIELPEKE